MKALFCALIVVGLAANVSFAQEPVVGGGKIVDGLISPGTFNATYSFDLRGIRYTNNNTRGVASQDSSLCFHGEYEPYSESRINIGFFDYSNFTISAWGVLTNGGVPASRHLGGVRDGASGHYKMIRWWHNEAILSDYSTSKSGFQVINYTNWNRRIYSIRQSNASNIVTWGAGSGTYGSRQTNYTVSVRNSDPFYVGSLADQNVWFDGRMQQVSIYNYAITNDCFSVGSSWRVHDTPPPPPQGNVYQ